MKITYFVHSTTADNELGLATGWNDAELSERGLLQAEQLRESVAGRFDLVISSDLIRAAETARIAFSPTRQLTDARLREIDYGTLSGRPSTEVKSDLLSFVDAPFPGGESYSDVMRRVEGLLADIGRDHHDKRVALVAHQAPQLALDVILYKKSWEQAFRDDWRNSKAWRAGWEHEI